MNGRTEDRGAASLEASILASVTSSVLAIDRDGRYLFASPSAAKAIGREPEDMVGKTWREVGLEEEAVAPLLRQYEEVLATGRPIRDELWSPTAKRYFLYEASPLVRDDTAIGVVFVMSDITERRLMESVLRQSEEKFRLIAERMMDTVYRVRLKPELRFEYVSPSVFEITGYAPEEHYADPQLWTKIVHPDDRSRLAEATREAKPKPIVLRWIRKDGRMIWTEQINVPIRDEKGEVVAIEGVARDVTERMSAEEELRRTAALLRAIVESAPEPVFVKGRDNTMLLANQATLNVIGKPAELVIGRKDTEFFDDPATGRNIMENDQRIMASGVTEVVEEHVMTSYGPRVFLSTKAPYRDERGEVVGLVGVTRDMTDREQAQRQAEEERARLRAILDTIPIGVIVSDAEGRMVEMNSAVKRTWGMDAPMLDSVGRYGEYLGWRPGTGERYRAEDWALARALRGETIVGEVIDIEAFDGARRTILNSAAPIRGVDDRVLGAVVTVQDITDIKRLELDLKRSNEELQHFAYVASHDLKEPLRMVTNYLQLLERKNADKLDDASRRYLGFAVDGATRMASMINDLLAYSRVQTGGGSLSKVDMDEVLATALKDLKLSIDESGASVTSDALPTVAADSGQMLLLLENLVSNAVKFHDVAAPQVHVSATGDGREWVFSVRDNGIGIPPGQRDKLFRMFQRLHTRDEYPGTGMGLAIAKKIVERHGGRIWFESEPGKGSTFYFSIPVRRAPGRA